MKVLVKLFNLVYIIFAAIACVALITKPLISITASVALPKETVSSFIYPSVEGQISQEDFDTALDKSFDENGNINIGLTIEVPAATIIYKDHSSIANGLTEELATTVDDVVNKLSAAIKELAKLVAKDAGKTAIKDSIAAQISNTNPDSNAYQIMEEVGIDDTYIENMTNEVFDLLLGNEEKNIEKVETVSELVTAINGNISDVCAKLADAGVEGYPQDPVELQAKIDSMSESIEKDLKESLLDANLCEEDGTIKDIDSAMDEFLISFLDKMMNPGEGEGEEENEPEVKSIVREVKADSEEEGESELKAKIRDFLTEKINSLNINEMVEQFWFVPLIFTLVLLFPWALFILITLLRTLRRHKYWAKPWVVFTLAFIQVIIGVALYLLTTKFMGQVIDMVPLPDSPVINIIKGSSLAIKTSALIPSLLYLVMIPFTIIYAIFAHKSKKDYKAYKREKKNK